MEKNQILANDNLLSQFNYKNCSVFTIYQGNDKLQYFLFLDDKVIFTGKDFRPSPMYNIDDPEAMVSLLGFLTLKKGDTDEDYFKDYDKDQFDFSESKMADEIREMLWEYEDNEIKNDERGDEFFKYFS